MPPSGWRTLGKFPLPVEVVRFGLAATRNMVEALRGRGRLRGRDQAAPRQGRPPFVTDGGNLILDCAFGRIDEPEMLDEALKRVPGVVENGLFLGIADVAIVAGPGRRRRARARRRAQDQLRLRCKLRRAKGSNDAHRVRASPRPGTFLALLPSRLRAGARRARLAAAKELMEVAGVAKQFDEVMPVLAQRLSESFVAVAPDKAESDPRGVRADGRQVRRSQGRADRPDRGALCREAHLEDLTAIIGFYKSPAGTKFIAVQPEIARQSMALGQRWGAQIGREIEAEARRELKKRGIDL